MQKLPSETCTCPRLHRCAHSLLIMAAALFVSAVPARAVAQSALFARDYTVIPAPHQVTLGEAEFQVDSGWRLVLGLTVASNDVAVEALKQDLKTRFDLTLREGSPADRKPALLLDVRPNSIVVGEVLDKDRRILAEQAYRIELSPEEIRITANASPGLFYGVETLVCITTSSLFPGLMHRPMLLSSSSIPSMRGCAPSRTAIMSSA
jgi:hexosaminidase